MGFSLFKNKIIILAALFWCVVMVALPEVTSKASKEAIGLWMNAVVPTLLPFLILSNFIKLTGIVQGIPAKIYPFIMGFLSGYPMGARIAGDYYRDGNIDQYELKEILSYSMITGPAFIVGAVGTEFFDSRFLGYILALSHYGSALLNGWLYGAFGQKKKKMCIRKGVIGENYSQYITDSILDSFKTIGIILAYIMMFLILTDLIQFAGVFSLFRTDYGVALAKGVLEMTAGCNHLISCSCSVQIKLIAASFLISFGGLSIIGQSASMLKQSPVNLFTLLKLKITHGLISGILTFTIYNFVI